MTTEKMTQELFNMFKSSTDTVWGTVSMLQNQTERMANLLLEQYQNLQGENKKHIEEWVNSTKKNQEEFKKAYYQGLEQVAEILKNKGE